MPLLKMWGLRARPHFVQEPHLKLRVVLGFFLTCSAGGSTAACKSRNWSGASRISSGGVAKVFTFGVLLGFKRVWWLGLGQLLPKVSVISMVRELLDILRNISSVWREGRRFVKFMHKGGCN